MWLDYKGIGLRAGLEVHQQIDTGKLFCRCPGVLREDSPDFAVRRLLRPSASEMWELDAAAVEQFTRKHEFVYHGYFDTTCEVELDESPPKTIDAEALGAILEIALMTKSVILPKVLVMRKAIIDGSNTSAFQRTALVAIDGSIEVDGKKVGVQSIIIEEDSARPVEKKEKEVIYKVDRLGVPLIELATSPELFTPGEVKNAAYEIGTIFRLTGKTKRGLGTIRQDINISIRDGERTEIKGVQDLENIDKYVEREAERQFSLVEIKKELQKRGLGEKSFEDSPVVGLGLAKNPVPFLKGKQLFGVKISFFAGLLGKELSPGRRLGTELADYVRAKTSLKGIIHSDEDLENQYQLTAEEVLQFRQKLGAKDADAFVLVAENSEEKAMEALGVVLGRARQCMVGVPKETRDALPDFNTKYSRPLAGAARMYPETDLSPIEIKKQKLEELKKGLPLDEKQRFLLYTKKLGLSEKLANEMKLSNFARFFEDLYKKGFDPKKTAVFLLETLTAAKREGADTDNLAKQKIVEILEQIKNGEITKELELEVIKQASQNPQKSIQSILSEKNITKASTGELEETVREIIQKNAPLVEEKGENAFSALMGEAMQKLKGKATGKQVSEEIKKQLAGKKQ